MPGANFDPPRAIFCRLRACRIALACAPVTFSSKDANLIKKTEGNLCKDLFRGSCASPLRLTLSNDVRRERSQQRDDADKGCHKRDDIERRCHEIV